MTSPRCVTMTLGDYEKREGIRLQVRGDVAMGLMGEARGYAGACVGPPLAWTIVNFPVFLHTSVICDILFFIPTHLGGVEGGWECVLMYLQREGGLRTRQGRRAE